MKRILIIASHHKFADGLTDTLNFISGGIQETVALSAYLDNQPIEDAVEELMSRYCTEDELVILTDLTSGSVNQQFFRFRNRPHTHIVSGMNLPIALQVAMEPQEDYISAERMRQMVREAQTEIKYVNDMRDDGDDEDE